MNPVIRLCLKVSNRERKSVVNPTELVGLKSKGVDLDTDRN